MQPSARQHSHEAELRRLHSVKQTARHGPAALGPELVQFFKRSVQKRQGKFAAVGQRWEALVPAMLNEHCALESFYRGTLTVLVDSSSHLYELKQLLLAGLEQQLMATCRAAGLRKIKLCPGRWYSGDSAATGKLMF